MHARVRDLIETLNMTPHSEGGYFREVYRASLTVLPADGRPLRPALTTIYYLLAQGQVSRWHRVRSDEAWHYYEGAPLELTWTDTERRRVTRHVLGPVGEADAPVAVVPAECWQTARPLGAYTLVGCTVGPGFDYQDFELMAAGGADVTEALQCRGRADPTGRT